MSPLASDGAQEKSDTVGSSSTQEQQPFAEEMAPRDDEAYPDGEATKSAVVSFLEGFDGWVWRANVKVEFGWSTPRTNMVLERLEEDGTVVRHRDQGAEVVALPGKTPDILLEAA